MHNPKYKEFLTDIKWPMLDKDITNSTKPNGFLEKLKKYFHEFSHNTSIHGFKYLSSGCILEKIWWIVVLCFCTYGCLVCVKSTFEKREDTPVFVSLNPTPMNMWDVPFPAVTICPTNKILQTKYNLTYNAGKADNFTGEELRKFADAITFYKNDWCYGQNRRLAGMNHSIGPESLDFFEKIAPSLDDIFQFCLVGKTVSCDKIFAPILTDSGLCFTFNMLDRKELFTAVTSMPKNHANHRPTVHWSVEDNYVKTLNETYPMRVRSVTDILYFVFKTQKSAVDKACRKFDGFKILLHHPAKAPILSSRYAIVGVDQSYKVWIKPEVMTTSPKLRDYEPQKRGCQFSNERPLKYYQIYNEDNCKLECFANYTLELCGCVPFYMPHDNHTRLCGFPDHPCIKKTKEWILRTQMEVEIFDDEVAKKKAEKFCGCLPSCTSIMYNLEIVSDNMGRSKRRNTSYTKIYLSFKDVKFVTMQRNELFSNTDFYASCGGLFSLFTGFSVVSLAEIVYFLTLKWICNLRRFW